MAARFSCDPEQAQQVSEKLLQVGGSISSNVTTGPQQGRIGSGVVDGAVSDFQNATKTAHENLAELVDKAATIFSSLSSGTTTLDRQEAERV